MPDPSRAEVWLVELSPTRGPEQAGRLPGLVVSVNRFNPGQAGLVVVPPITSKPKGIPFHVSVEPPEAGLKVQSFIKCEDIPSVAKERLARRLGTVSPTIIKAVEDRLPILLGP